ncbi:hypothetical protein, partial [Lactococcus petauri]|uniref:hypothetical protein n=1 Tax=Lactococcus petauri TaxID=1940789 RepID=UPI0021F1E2B0
TNTFNAGKSYIIEFEVVGHAGGSNRALQVEFFGETAGAYSAVIRCSASITVGNRAYGRGEIFTPRNVKKTQSFNTCFADVVTTPGTD